MRSLLVSLASAILFAVIAVATAQAQPVRTFVASNGNDNNPCSALAPCRTLQVGINLVASGGDVLITDSGGFGTNIIITKSVSVLAAPGAQARIAVANNSPGVTINGNAINVTLNGLGISGTSSNGVIFAAGRTLSLREMDINVTGQNGIGVYQTAASSHLTMSNSTIRNSGTCFMSLGGSTQSTIVNSTTENCLFGFYILNSATALIERTKGIGKPGACQVNFYADGSANLALDQVVSSGCQSGVFVAGSARLLVSNSVITGNAEAGSNGAGGGIGRTSGDNRVFKNGSDTLAGFSSLPGQ